MKRNFNFLLELTEKWWFFLVLFAAQFFLFPITTKNFEFSEFGIIIGKTLSNSLMGDFKNYYLYFQFSTIIILLVLFIFKNRFKRFFTIYVIISYVLFGFLQNIGITEEYGISIMTINLIMFLFVGLSWINELLNQKNDYSFNNLNWKTSWLVAISLICFWWPLNWKTLEFSPDLYLFIDNGSSLAFCAMTPIYLIIMIFNLPNINFATFRITSLIGLIIGFYNMMNFSNPNTYNIAIMHLPLVIVSIYSLILSYKKHTTMAKMHAQPT